MERKIEYVVKTTLLKGGWTKKDKRIITRAKISRQPIL